MVSWHSQRSLIQACIFSGESYEIMDPTYTVLVGSGDIIYLSVIVIQAHFCSMVILGPQCWRPLMLEALVKVSEKHTHLKIHREGPCGHRIRPSVLIEGFFVQIQCSSVSIKCPSPKGGPSARHFGGP